MNFRVPTLAVSFLVLCPACDSAPGTTPDATPGTTPDAAADASSASVELLKNGDFSELVTFADVPQVGSFRSFANALLSTQWPDDWLGGFTQDDEGAEVLVGPATSGMGFEIRVTDDSALPFLYEVNLTQTISRPPPGDYELSITVDGATNGPLELCPIIDTICGERIFGPGSEGCLYETITQERTLTLSFTVPDGCDETSVDISLWSFVDGTVGDYALIYRSASLRGEP